MATSIHAPEPRAPLSPWAEIGSVTGVYRCMHCRAPAHSQAAACRGCGVAFTGASRFQLVAPGQASGLHVRPPPIREDP
jgi:hypothetical protein